MAKVSFPYQYFPDPTRGKPLFNGSIYIGTAGTDPEVTANQIQAYAVTESGDIAVPQPLKTGSGGVVMYSGSAVGVRVDVDSYSIKMLDSNGSQVYYAANFSPSATLAEIEPVAQTVVDTDVTNRLVERFASVDALKLASLPSGQRVSTRSYYAQDIAQGGAEYDILTLQEVRDAKGDPAWVPDGYGDHTLANGNVAVLVARNKFNVLSFGCQGDGVTDNTIALQAALDRAAINGGIVYMPEGVYIVSDPNSDAGSFVVRSNTTLMGAGVESTKILLADNTNANILNIDTDATNVRVTGLTVDGNRLNQVAGHTMRAGGVDGLYVDNVKLQNAFFYGIGFQAGTNKNVFIDTVIIKNVGADGIDIKNYNDGNSEIYITNTIVDGHAQDLSLSIQAGIDCRGVVTLDNVSVLNVRDNAIGIRFREGDPTDKATYPAGAGGRLSRLSNFRISSDGAGGHIASAGLYIADPQITITNGRVSGLNRNVETAALADEISISNVYSRLANSNCFYIGAAGTRLSNCIGNTSQDVVRVRYSDFRASNCEFVGGTRYGANIDASLAGVKFTTCEFDGASANVLNNSTAGVIFSNTMGTFVTQQHNEPWPYGATGNRPASPATSQKFFDTTINKPIWYNGTNWVDATGTTV